MATFFFDDTLNFLLRVESKRKRQREAKRLREEKERQIQVEGLKRSQKEKKKEIQEYLKELQSITGNSTCMYQVLCCY
jgi:uncharacterized protein YlxW (UPF0749 family)